jgi:hypothetical protein
MSQPNPAPAAAAATVGGTSFGSLLFLVFLVLRLTGVITWSWWWVTAPLWIPFMTVNVIFIVLIITAITVTGRGRR